MKDNLIKKLHYLIPPIIVLILFGILMFLKGIYPFGTNLVANLSLDSTYIPAYYKLYDILHGNASIFYDYNLGGGTSILGMLISNGLLNPISWLVFFVKRTSIPQFMSFLVLLKLMIISITTYFSFNKIFKNTGKIYNIIFSVTYALSGYILLMYSNIVWLDAIALLPLIVLGLKEIFDTKKSRLFVISLSLSLIFNYKISLMILLFIIIFTFLGTIYINKKDKKEIILKFLTYTVMSLLISAFAILPSYNIINNAYVINYFTNDLYIMNKLIYFFPLSLAIILFIKQLLNRKKDKNYSNFYLLLFITTILGIFIPGVNRVWNMDNSYIFSYAFIPIFVLILGSMHYIDNNKKIFNTKVNNKLALIGYILLNIFLFYVVDTFDNVFIGTNLSTNVDYLKQFIALFIMFILNVGIMYISFLNDEKIRKYLLVISTCINIIVFGSFYITVSSITSSNYINKMSTRFELNDNLYRYKDNTLLMSSNYSMPLNIPTIAGSTNSLSEHSYRSYYKLGYLTSGSDILSSGGTIFSDLLLSNKYIISYTELPSSLYNLIELQDEIYYYESKYNLSYAIPYFGTSYNSLNKDIDTFAYQNDIYQKLFDKKDEIINIIYPEVKLENIEVTEDNYFYPTGENSKMIINLDIKSLSNLYLNLDVSYGGIYNIIVNGNVIKNPTLTNRQNKNYPVSDQTTIYLGQFEDESIVIELKTEECIIDNIALGVIDIDKFINLVNDNKENINITKKMSTMKIDYNNIDNNKSLLIPINYDSNFTITNNGKKINYTSNFDNYISFDIESGNNSIVIKYKPKYFDLGIFITLFNFILFNLFVLLNKKFNISEKLIVKNICILCFYIIMLIILFNVYLIPLF